MTSLSARAGAFSGTNKNSVSVRKFKSDLKPRPRTTSKEKYDTVHINRESIRVLRPRYTCYLQRIHPLKGLFESIIGSRNELSITH